jgi:hypothetical protein
MPNLIPFIILVYLLVGALIAVYLLLDDPWILVRPHWTSAQRWGAYLLFTVFLSLAWLPALILLGIAALFDRNSNREL